MKITISLLVATLSGLLQPARAADMILYNFTGGLDGSLPRGSLTLSNSTLYGMTEYNGSGGYGTIFSVSTSGSGFNVLHSFAGGTNDGGNPLENSLTLSGPKLYGMTPFGGGNVSTGVGYSTGYGTLFSINSDGTGFSLLHSFTASGSNNINATDGGLPSGTPVVSGSTIYGMTENGGSGGYGTLFSINTNGTGFNVLHSFTGGYPFTTDPGDGRQPVGSLTLSGTNLYGMTQGGGSNGSGTLFSINTNGTGYTIIHNFNNNIGEGEGPVGSLTLAGSKLYGMTSQGGSGHDGTIFSVNLDGSGLSVLHSFTGSPSDGSFPHGSLIISGSKLYGLTEAGGSSAAGFISGDGDGTLFSINTDGTGYSILQNFSGSPGDGEEPDGDLTLSVDGQALYGMTAFGGLGASGSGGDGVIFAVSVPEPRALAMMFGGMGMLVAYQRLRKVNARQ